MVLVIFTFTSLLAITVYLIYCVRLDYAMKKIRCSLDMPFELKDE